MDGVRGVAADHGCGIPHTIDMGTGTGWVGSSQKVSVYSENETCHFDAIQIYLAVSFSSMIFDVRLYRL